MERFAFDHCGRTRSVTATKWTMKRSHEPKPNIVHRLLSSALLFKKEHHDHRPKSPVLKFKYQLPKSFLEAVDHARNAAGYDLLPRFRPRSASPSIGPKMSSSTSSSLSSSSSSHYFYNQSQAKPKVSCSPSTDDLSKVTTKKVPFRRTARGQVHHHATAPVLFPSRPRFPVMMNPNLMMINRSRRPPNVLPMRPPLLMQQQPRFFRFQLR